MSKGEDKEGKSEEKRISGEACDINKQAIHIVPKSKIESRVHYTAEPARGKINASSRRLVHRVRVRVMVTPTIDLFTGLG